MVGKNPIDSNVSLSGWEREKVDHPDRAIPGGGEGSFSYGKGEHTVLARRE